MIQTEQGNIGARKGKLECADPHEQPFHHYHRFTDNIQ